MFDRPLIVHTREHVHSAFCAAHSLNAELTIQSAPSAIFYAGALYLKMMIDDIAKDFPEVRNYFILDCADDASLALFALRSGQGFIRLNLSSSVHRKINDIANQLGGKCLIGKYRALDLAQVREPRTACLEWLAEAAV